MEKVNTAENIDWTEIAPDNRNTWLTEGLVADFDTFIPIGIKESRNKANDGVIFEMYSNGLKTNRDNWVYNFQKPELELNIQRTIEFYNDHVSRWGRKTAKIDVDNFATNDDERISWSRDLKKDLQRGKFASFEQTKVRYSIYRPFTKQFLFFDRMLNEEIYQTQKIFPNFDTENLVICVAGIGNRKEFGCLITKHISALDLAFEKAQCFPLYVYDEDGSNRRENISDWALAQFNDHYGRGTAEGTTVNVSESSRRAPTGEPHTSAETQIIKNDGVTAEGSAVNVLESSRRAPTEGENSAFIIQHSAITKWDIFYY